MQWLRAQVLEPESVGWRFGSINFMLFLVLLLLLLLKVAAEMRFYVLLFSSQSL